MSQQPLPHQEPVTGKEPSPEQDQDAQVREPGRVQELVATLQRLGAEYANYRKRAERDRMSRPGTPPPGC